MVKHPHFDNALRDLKARYGVDVADIAPGELFGLVEAVKRVENPFEGVNADALGFPVKVCDGLHFWKLSAGANVWLDEYAARWWGDKESERKYFWALCYALANSRRKDAFVKLDTKEAAREAIRRFTLSCPATPEEMALAVDKVLGRVEDMDDPRRNRALMRNALDWAQLSARLEGESGIKQDDWLWGRSASYTIKAYNDLAIFAKRYGAAGGDCGGAEGMMDELNGALVKLAKTIRAIGLRAVADRKATADKEATGDV